MGAPFDVAAFRSPPSQKGTSPLTQAIAALGQNDFPPAVSDNVLKGCANLRWAVHNQAKVSEPYWRDVPIGIAKFCLNPEATAHAWSREHTKYDFAETQGKLDNWSGTGAPLCSTLELHNPDACVSCPHHGKIRSPIALGYPEKVTSIQIPSGLCIEAGLLILSILPPPKRLWAIDKLMALGKYAILAGLGGVSKTMMAIVWAAHVAIGKTWAGLSVAEGAVLMVLGEEDREEVNARFGAICRDMTDEERRKVMKRILAFPWAGKDMHLTRLTEGNPTETLLPDEIIKLSHEQAKRSDAPVRLIVLDHARLIIGGDPNDAQHVTEVTRVMTKIADTTGAAVLLIAHSPKSVIGKSKPKGKSKTGEDADAGDIAGSIAWVDNSRAAMVMTTMREDEAKAYGIAKEARHSYAKLHLVKANYAPTGWETWLQREKVDAYGVSIPQVAELTLPTKESTDKGLESRILDLVASMSGQLSINKIRTYYAGKSKRLAASEGDVEEAIRKLLDSGRLMQRPPTDEEKMSYGLTRTPFVLEVG